MYYSILITGSNSSLTDVAIIAIAVTVSVVLSVILAAVIILLLTYFCYIKKKNSKRSTQDMQLQQSPAYGILNTKK